MRPGVQPAAGVRVDAGLLVLLGALSAFSPFATDTYLGGMPAMARDLGSDLARIQLSLSSYFLGMCLGQLLYGPLCDAWGRRRPLLVGAAVFVLASLLLMLVNDAGLLIGGRFVQAMGGCAGVIVARAVIQDLLQGREAARALTLMMMVQGLGPVLAPLVGAGLIALGGWRSVFAFMALFSGLCWLAVLWRLPETLPPAARVPLRPRALAATFGGLLGQRAFLLPTLTGAVAMAAMFAYITGSPGVFVQQHGMSPAHYGWLFASNGLGMVLAGQLNVRLLRRHAPAQVLRWTTWVMTAAALALLLLGRQASTWALIVPLFLCIACVPLVAANSTALAMAAGRKMAGSASSLLGAVQFGFAALASTLVGVLENGTALPMAGVMLVCTATATLLAWHGSRSVSGD